MGFIGRCEGIAVQSIATLKYYDWKMMNILIIENEIYLAQKVVSRLLDDGHSCDYIESPNIDNLTKSMILYFSTSLPSNLCKNIIKKYSENSIIILLVSYISDETNKSNQRWCKRLYYETIYHG